MTDRTDWFTDEQVEKAAIVLFDIDHYGKSWKAAAADTKDNYRTDARAALRAVNPFEWREMDSAPKDGSRFLAMGGGLDRIEVTEWCDRVGAWSTESWTLEDHDHESQGYNRPLYWMPLPSTQEGK